MSLAERFFFTNDHHENGEGFPSVHNPLSSSYRGISDFSSEVLTRIFLKLSYKSLLSLLAVSVQWNTIINKDRALRVQMFKKRSKVYVKPGCRDPADARLKSAFADRTRARFMPCLRLHPAVQVVSYMLGEDLQSVCFYIGQGDDPPELAKLAIANDFISIPAVTTLNIEITQNFNVVVKNNKGVRLVDVFTAMERESTRKIKTRRRMVERYELLGNHRFFEGFTNLI
ncbi:hypothetical protein DFH09DRAFT_1369714, partial [Mycena vulgaris]